MDIQSRITAYRKEFVICIVSEGVLSRLPDIIPHEDANRLRQQYEQNSQQATSEMLDILIQSQEPGKWKTFLEALKEEEYDYLAYLLETNANEERDFKRERRIIQLFWPRIAKQICPTDLVSHLYQDHIITMEDMQEINTKYNNHGRYASAVKLLERMQVRQKPMVWYRGFLTALYETGEMDLLQELEPDFIHQKKVETGEAMDTSVPSSSTMDCTVTDTGKAHVPSKYYSAPSPENQFEADSSSNSYNNSDLTAETDICDGGEEVIRRIDKSARKRPSEDWKQSDDEKKRKLQKNTVKCMDDTASESENYISSPDAAAQAEDATTQDGIVETKGRSRCDALKINDSEDSAYNQQNKGLKERGLNLRNYQLELAKNALNGDNTIVCCETGSGKTRVAMYIVQKHLETTENGKVVFMASQGTLIKQQADKFKQMLSMYECKLLTGEDDNSKALGLMLEGYPIFFMTPQILLNNLEWDQSPLSLNDFSLFIFDECHHTKKDEPYNKLMRLYLDKKHNSVQAQHLPQVVGLTASIGVGETNAVTDITAKDYILSVCANLDARDISTVEDKDNLKELSNYASRPKQDVERLLPRTDDPCQKTLIQAMVDVENELEDLVVLSKYHSTWNARPKERRSQDYINWTAKLTKHAQESDTDNEEARNVLACAKYLNILSSALEVNELLLMDHVNKFLYDRLKSDINRAAKLNNFERTLLSKLKDHVKKMSRFGKETENPNTRKVSNILRTMLVEKGETSRAMVFVKTRETCKRLAEFLDEDLKAIDAKAAPLYGKENRREEEGMTESKQHETVERFRDGFYKVLVATTVGSEGIDVPDCNIVMNYNSIGNEVQKIQMFGRCRPKEGGSVITMGDEKAIDKERINAFKAATMYRAIDLVKKMPKTEYEAKLIRLQKEELRKEKTRRALEIQKQNKRTDTSIYALKCSGLCDSFACQSTDIRTLKSNHHVVVNKEFADKIEDKPHPNPKRIEGMNKERKIECKKCGKEWGVIFTYNGRKCWTLLLKAFKFVNLDYSMNRSAEMFKRWIDVPFKPSEITDEEFMNMLPTADY